jgi:Uma2 family endonuclease
MKDNKVEDPTVAYEKNYTYADYLKFTFDEMVEIINGKIFKMSPAPSSNHQNIVGNLFSFLHNHLRGQRCKVFVAPFDVILPVKGKDFEESNKVVQPDIVVICNREIIQERGCFGVPDWVIEILSPHTTKKDLQLKFDLYEEAGVKEYWIIEPKNQTVEVFVLEATKYRRVRTYVTDDLIPSNTLEGLVIDLKEIFDME